MLRPSRAALTVLAVLLGCGWLWAVQPPATARDQGAGTALPAAGGEEPVAAAAPEHGGMAGSRMTPWAPAAPTWTVLPFVLRDGFWVNLHHFLYQQALAASKQVGVAAAAAARQGVAEPPSPEERAAWSQALRFYADTVVGRDLLFDGELNEADYGLAALDDGAAIAGAGLPAGMAAALERAAPIYRAHWWPGHDRANRFWIAAVTPLVEQLGPRMMEQLAAAYGEPWPRRGFLVDVAVYANWAGAYTATRGEVRPVHTVVSSFNPGYQGFAALEMIFHEASHAILNQRTDPITTAIEREDRALGQPPPRDLTHAIIFYTAGEVARRSLATVGVTDYVPYAERQGLWQRAWPAFKAPLAQFWQDYLDGKLARDAAIARIVQALGIPGTPGKPGGAGHG